MANKTFNLFGLEISVKKKKVSKTASKNKQKISLSSITKDPLNSKSHFDLAYKYFNIGNYYAAWAELKTSEHLGFDAQKIKDTEPIFKAKIPDLTGMNHNQYFRFITLRNEILKHTSDLPEKPLILDIGGGSGELSSFIPEYGYCLVEPTVNGINGLEIPFENESFDLVVSCHVLEHIPGDEREKFLDQLLSKSKKGIVLLNPIDIQKTLPRERTQLFIDITDAQWAKEHLECDLPTVDSIEEYAKNRNLKLHYTPNGTMTTTLGLVLFDFLSKHLDKEKYIKVNKFINTKYLDILDSEKYPNAGLFYLEK